MKPWRRQLSLRNQVLAFYRKHLHWLEISESDMGILVKAQKAKNAPIIADQFEWWTDAVHFLMQLKNAK